MLLKKQGRMKSPIWLHFIEKPLLNSSHYEAKCKYCSGKMGGVLANILKHLKEEYPKVNNEFRISLYELINTNNNTKKIEINVHVLNPLN
ncbi:hypothetical protein RCL_jg7663.t1 [Rhizophagus clarus]|uniref:BED-type domain-containing protein n=1 Tax=Rhizophagus clarus TaxID=94130 RepID=A0A8H3M6X7_9GLOM|nr:hypothetical protein RCL_jg7663.t1 [Rhizophagus clarus]